MSTKVKKLSEAKINLEATKKNKNINSQEHFTSTGGGVIPVTLLCYSGKLVILLI
jgi:hypothetical protein